MKLFPFLSSLGKNFYIKPLFTGASLNKGYGASVVHFTACVTFFRRPPILPLIV